MSCAVSFKSDLVPEPQGQVEEERSWVSEGERMSDADPRTTGAHIWIPSPRLGPSGQSATATAQRLPGHWCNVLASWAPLTAIPT